MSSLKNGLFLCAASFAGAAFPAYSGNVTTEQFQDWVEARCGTGDAVYWYARGDARAFPGGEVLFGLDFMEENRLVTDPDNPEAKTCLGRKMYLFVDKDTGLPLRQFRGSPVEQMIYPYQMIAMSLKDGGVSAVATQGAGEFLRVYNMDDTIRIIDSGGRRSYDAAAMFTSRREAGVLNTFEYLTYVMPPEVGGVQDPNPGIVFTLGYERPAWAGGDGESDFMLQHLVGARVATYGELPAHIRHFIETDAPAFVEPPVDLAEIKRLQEGG